MPKVIDKMGLLIFVLIGFVACGSIEDDAGEDFGNIINSPSGLTLMEEEHVFGWGRSECLMCHNVNNIHQEDRTGLDVDVEEIQQMTFEFGEAACQDCHGANGTD